LKGKEHLIELQFLPGYAPKLNAVEYVRRKTKRTMTHNRYFRRFEDLKRALARRFNWYQGNPASLRTTVPLFS
jgi:transposase